MANSNTLAKLLLALGHEAAPPLRGSSLGPKYPWETGVAYVSVHVRCGAVPLRQEPAPRAWLS